MCVTCCSEVVGVFVCLRLLYQQSAGEGARANTGVGIALPGVLLLVPAADALPKLRFSRLIGYRPLAPQMVHWSPS